MNNEGQGWHYDSYDHELARRGVKTRNQPLISEEEAQQVVATLKGKSPTQVSQAKAQMEWYEENWIKGTEIPDSNLDGLEVDELQRIRKKAESYQTAAADHQKDFYGKEISRVKTKIKEKLSRKREELGKQMEELGGGGSGGMFG